MKPIKLICEFNRVYSQYKRKNNNFLLFKSNFESAIDEKRFFCFEYQEQLFVVIDQIYYNDLYFFSDNLIVPLDLLKKTTCITIITKDSLDVKLKESILKNEFIETPEIFRFVLDLRNNSLISKVESSSYLNNFSLKNEFIPDESKRKKIKDLWMENLPKQQVQYEDLTFKSANHINNVYLEDEDKEICAIYSFFDKNKIREMRHLVVSKKFRRMHLGSFVTNYIINDAKEKNINFCKTWIQSTNIESIALHEKLGFKKDNLFSYQFIYNIS